MKKEKKNEKQKYRNRSSISYSLESYYDQSIKNNKDIMYENSSSDSSSISSSDNQSSEKGKFVKK